jgi:dihydrolipoamide dehydrogenase
MRHHIVVVGAGPGGTGAALEAARRGTQVTIIERDEMGGTCLNRGCIPTKTILSTARILTDIRHSGRMNITASGDFDLDLDALRNRKDEVISTLRSQLEAQCSRAGIEVLKGKALLRSDHSIEVAHAGEKIATIKPDALIIATGSKPYQLPFIDHSLTRVWTSDDALELSEIPEEIIILGGGVIGVEFATAYAAFGSKVTIVELADRILAQSDARSSRTLATALKAQGITILTKTSLEKTEQVGERILATLSTGEVIEADVLLSAVGRKPVLLPTLSLDGDGAPNPLTAEQDLPYPHVVIGDASNGIMLAHAAEAQGEVAARNLIDLLDGKDDIDLNASMPTSRDIPACVYTHPEVAEIGLTAQMAKERGMEVAAGIAKFAGNGKAAAQGDVQGFVSVVADKQTGAILGAQIVGSHAVELITQIALAMKMNATTKQVASTIFAHPTLSEVIKTACTLAR